MSDILTFETREAAQAEIDGMMGWNARAVRVLVSDPSDPTKPRWMLVIEVRQGGCDPMYMRTDGFVR